jgi:chromosome condensin MukBEF complex kleisin-like MukF subunit
MGHSPVNQKVKFITKLFKNTSMDIAFKTNNSIEEILKPK